MKRLTVFVLALIMVVSLAVPAGAVINPDDYRQNPGDKRWYVKLNNFISAVAASFNDITNLISNFISWNQDFIMAVTAVPTYVDADTFTLPGNHTGIMPPARRLQIDLGVDGLKPNSVNSSSYGAPLTTVNLQIANLTANIRAVNVVATRTGLWPHGPGYIMARDFGVAGQTAINDAKTYIGSVQRTLIVAPEIPGQSETWTISDKLIIPANITLKVERGAVLSVTIPDVDIAGMTRANPCQVTWTGHGLSTGDKVFISGITQTGWTYLNGGQYTITKVNDNAFTILVNTSSATYFPANYNPATDPGKISKVLYISGGLQAGEYQIFAAAPGKVAFGPGAVDAVKPEWWGAVPDGVTDCSQAIQAAFNSLPLNNGGHVHFANGKYYLVSQVNLPGIVTDANTNRQCIIKITGDNSILYTDQAITMLTRGWPSNENQASSYAYASFVVDGINFRGTSNRAQIGLDLHCTYASKISNLRFDTLGIGLRLTYAMMPEVTNCMAYDCVITGYATHSGRDLWPATSTYSTNTGIFRSCRAYCNPHVEVAIPNTARANPTVFNWTSHGLSSGDLIFIDKVTQADWTALNHRRFAITKINNDSFSIAVDSTGYGADYVQDANGKYGKWVGGFRLINSTMDFYQCITEGNNPTDDIYIDTVGWVMTSNYIFDNHHSETVPYGATLYLKWYGGKIHLINFYGNAGSGSCNIDAYDTAAAVYGTIKFFGYHSSNSGKIRLPADSVSQCLWWDFSNCGGYGQGLDMTNTAYWWGEAIPNFMCNYSSYGWGPAHYSPFWRFYVGEGVYVRKTTFGAFTYKGLKAEAVSDGTGGLGTYDSANSQTTMLRQKAQEITITANATPTQTVTNFIPAGVMVIGFTVRVTEAIGGATTFGVEDVAGTPVKWLTGVGVSLGSTGNLAKSDPTTCPGPKIYAATSNITIRGNANFDGTGKVRITCHYIYLEPPGS